MAWSWSHTAEAYQNARDNLEKLPRETLNIIYAEWRAAQGKHGNSRDENGTRTEFNEKKYARALAYAENLGTALPSGIALGEDFAREVLVDFIWERAEDFATCDNGGFNAWLCPHGCGPHCVPFDPS